MLWAVRCSDDEARKRIALRNEAAHRTLYIATDTFDLLKARVEPLGLDEPHSVVSDAMLAGAGSNRLSKSRNGSRFRSQVAGHSQAGRDPEYPRSREARNRPSDRRGDDEANDS